MTKHISLMEKFSPKDLLGRLYYETIDDWYSSKHRKITIIENAYINSISMSFCPGCRSTNIIKNGHRGKDHIQIYKCKDCSLLFNPLTGTIFDNRKIPISEWFEFVWHLKNIIP